MEISQNEGFDVFIGGQFRMNDIMHQRMLVHKKREKNYGNTDLEW
jgi:hypothetical protein